MALVRSTPTYISVPLKKNNAMTGKVQAPSRDKTKQRGVVQAPPIYNNLNPLTSTLVSCPLSALGQSKLNHVVKVAKQLLATYPMAVVLSLFQLAFLLSNVWTSYKTLKPPPTSRRRDSPSARAISARKRELKSCLAVWIVWVRPNHEIPDFN